MMSKPTVLLGMSGGVDSSVAALLLTEQGYDVQGVTLQVWEPEDEHAAVTKKWEEMGNDLTVKMPVDSDAAVEFGFSFEVDTFSEKRIGAFLKNRFPFFVFLLVCCPPHETALSLPGPWLRSYGSPNLLTTHLAHPDGPVELL